MQAPIVQVLFKGRMLKSVPFEGSVLRIGRMRENDIVINNLSVSRFHAELHRRGDAIVLEDCGSENGCFVNGSRVERAEVRAGDEILIGKHQLVLCAADAAHEAPAAPEAPVLKTRSDPWDGAKTYLMGPDTVSKLLGGTPATAAPPPPAPASSPPAMAAPASPPPFGARSPSAPAHGKPRGIPAPPRPSEAPKPLALPAAQRLELPPEPPEPELTEPEPVTAPETTEPDLGPMLAAPGESGRLPTADLGFELGGDGSIDPLDPDPPKLHAGFIVQLNGKLDRVLRWDRSRMTVGRSSDCEVVLSDPEVSRRHALFHREGECFEVRDLDSINGTWVNGQRVQRHKLAVGDVVRIESFELTFVLEDHPLDDEVQAEAPVASAATQDSNGLTMLEERSPLAPVAVVAAAPAAAPAPVAAPKQTFTLEIELRAGDLPEALRRALEAEGALRLPAEIRLRRSD